MEGSVFGVDFDQEFKIITHPDLKLIGDRLRTELADLDFTRHFAIFSSGTTSRELKGYILSDKAMATNARAVNEWFGLSSDDVWGLSLPIYHVGGLSVLMRAKLLGNKVIDLRGWNPQNWIKNIQTEKISITTIVPAQLYDLVKNGFNSPPTLRHLIVGGDFLPGALEEKAMNLGWPVIRTYGMTEVCSQLASGKTPGDALRVLPIHEVRTSREGMLQVKSQALFTAVFTLGEELRLRFSHDLVDEDGFYETQDRVEITRDKLLPLGRANDEIKIAGHLTSVLGLKDALSKVLLENDCFGKAEVQIETDARKGKRLVLLHQGLDEKVLALIQEALRPAQIDETRFQSSFTRTELGKLKSSQE